MSPVSHLIEDARVPSFDTQAHASLPAAVKQCKRWGHAPKIERPGTPSTAAGSVAEISSSDEITMTPPPPVANERFKTRERGMRSARGSKSFILQHYHSTGCAGGAFSWRAAQMDPKKGLHLCTQRREFKETTTADIQVSLNDKRRGGGPRVGPFQDSIPGQYWEALPKYDLETKARSSAFNERMHVEWENHVDHILENQGELPTASVVAKAGFRSCAPCCRDMLALAQPTGKTFIMVDLAEDDTRGTFHFVCGETYLPVAKEALEPNQVRDLKKIVLDAQANKYPSSESISAAVMSLHVPVDEKAQTLYLGDQALLPSGCAGNLKGSALLKVLHAEHFARLSAEYGASILRDPEQPSDNKDAVRACRSLAQEMLFDAWAPNLSVTKGQLQNYTVAAVSPLLSEEPVEYTKLRSSGVVRHQQNSNAEPAVVSTSCRNSKRRWHLDPQNGFPGQPMSTNNNLQPCKKETREDDAASTIAASTAAPDDCASVLQCDEDCWSDNEPA